MRMKISGMVECLDNDVVACFDEGVVAFLYEGLLSLFDKNNKANFDVDIRHALMCVFHFSFHSHNL